MQKIVVEANGCKVAETSISCNYLPAAPETKKPFMEKIEALLKATADLHQHPDVSGTAEGENLAKLETSIKTLIASIPQ